MLVVEMDQMLHHLHEGIAFAGLERRQNKPLRRLNHWLDVVEQAAARRRDVKGFRAPVDGAAQTLDELFLFQAAHDISDGRSIERDYIAERRLIHARVIVDGDDCRILHRRYFEVLGLIHEQSKRNLLQPANEMTGLFKKTIIAF